MPVIRITCTPTLSGMPKTWFRPALACCAPNPSEVARPNSVANTASVSMMWPAQPHTLSPKIG